jgi:hypothetical protein
VAFSTGSGRKRLTTPTGVPSARRLPLGKDANAPVCGPRWGQLEIASTTRCANRSLRRSNASLSRGSRSPIDRRLVAPSLTSLMGSTICVDCTRPSTTNHPSTANRSTSENNRSLRSVYPLSQHDSLRLSTLPGELHQFSQRSP